MALLTKHRASIAGTLITSNAAAAADTLDPDDDGILIVRNASGVSTTVTVAVPGNTRYGLAQPDVAVVVAAGAARAVGPFPSDLADPADGLVHITTSPTASVTFEYVV